MEWGANLFFFRCLRICLGSKDSEPRCIPCTKPEMLKFGFKRQGGWGGKARQFNLQFALMYPVLLWETGACILRCAKAVSCITTYTSMQCHRPAKTFMSRLARLAVAATRLYALVCSPVTSPIMREAIPDVHAMTMQALHAQDEH